MISEKKLTDIKRLTVFMQVIESNIGVGIMKYWNGNPYNAPPETWTEDAVHIWDMMSEIENNILEKVLEILSLKNNPNGR